MSKHAFTVDPDTKSYSDYIGPKYWLVWFSLACLWLLTRLPFYLQMRIGHGVGWLSYHLVGRRRKVTLTNIALCFPEMDEHERVKLAKSVFVSYGKGLVETALSWMRPKSWFAHRVTIDGWENIKPILASGKGVVLVGGHFAILDLFGALVSPDIRADMVQRNHDNALFDLFMTRARESFGGKCIARRDVRRMVRSLRSGRVLWYPPDQDYGRKDSAFVPFFNIPAATITSTSGLARLGKAAVVPVFFYRTEGDNYRIRFYPALNIPSGDDVQDAAEFMQFIEARVREHPDQYLWMHRRFKTRPEGEESVYK